VGFPRTWLLTTTSPTAAAGASCATAAHSTPPRAAHQRRARRSAASRISAATSRFARAHGAPRRARIRYCIHVQGVMTDEGAGRMTLRATASRQTGDIAVKNLRIIGSAVLLLNFREVGCMHLCSTGVTV